METQWPDILTELEAEDITKSMDATPEFPEKRKQTENQKELRLQFKENVFMKVLNSVNDGMENRFTAVNKINSLFGFLWTYTSRTEEALKENCKLLSDKYPDVSAELPEEIRSLMSIHESNFGSATTNQFRLR